MLLTMGAKSYFLIDDKIQPMDQETPDVSKTGAPDQAGILSGKTILVIDDNPINLVVAEKTLRKFGAESIKALSAKDGVHQFSTKKVDLILMDLHMPGIDGFEATNLIKETEAYKKAKRPILAYTTYALDEVKEKIDKFGLDGYVGKPFTQEQVLETIIDYLGVEDQKKDN